MWYGLKDKKVHDTALEGSQRTRGFAHVTLGAVAALHAGTNELYMYENGFGALNLPFDAAQVGIETSKAANPVFHRAMEGFIGTVSGQPFRIVNPFEFLTKAQALRAAGVGRFGLALAETFSCERFPDWREGKPQCGTCSSCILRRLSLESAGLARLDPGHYYARDVKSPSFLPGDSAASVLSHYQEQASRFEAALGLADPWAALAVNYPELHEAEAAISASSTPGTEVRSSLLELLTDHVAEWRSFSGRAALSRYLLAA